VNRRALAIALACAVLVSAGLALVVFRSASPARDVPPAASAALDPPKKADTERSGPAARSPAATAAAASRPVEVPPAARGAELGTLNIVSDVPGAQVFIDRKFVGKTPVTAGNITPGPHRLNVEAEGFDGVAQSIDVEPGPRDIEIRLREVILDASVAVVHKHRLGSCTGRLVASPAGIRYETADKEDAFTTVLADLEAFQVDYIEKNLRLRLRGGRQYNFTDPDGNADRLFVFHRDVDKARARLAKGDTPVAKD
jgi:PEGA domain